MIGVLGRVWARAVCVSQPSFTTSPDSATITDWDGIEGRGGGWALGAGPYTGVVPIGGWYQVALDAEVNATEVGAAAVEAGFIASFGGVALGLFSPAWAVDDTNGTTWVKCSSVGIVELVAGDPLAVSILSHDSDASLAGLGIHNLTLSLVRLGS